MKPAATQRPRIALVRGPGLSVFELQSYEPLMNRFDMRALGLDQHAVDTDTLAIPVERLRWKDSVSGRSVLNAYHSRLRGQRYYMPGLEEKLKDFDLIHSAEITSTFSWQCAKEKKKLRRPLVITCTENVRHPGWNEPEVARFKKTVLSAADHYFALTPDSRDVLISEQVDPEKISVIPFGIDIERLSPGRPTKAWKERLGVGDKELVITYAGRFVWEKGIFDLLSAVRELDLAGLRLLFVGGGPEGKNLESLIRKLDLSEVASVHPAVPYGQMEQVYRLSDIVVLPSMPTRGVREQFGMTLAEAMACGKPVIATRCGSMPWVVGDAGLLADPGSSTSIAQCLQRLRASADLRRELGMRGRRIAEERYDKSRVAERIGGIFTALLSQVRNP